MKYLISTIIFFSLVCTNFGQTSSSTIPPFNNSWVISVEGGLSIGETDFPESKIDYSGRGLVEYFLPTSSAGIFGIRLFILKDWKLKSQRCPKNFRRVRFITFNISL